jgi:hypothetical protein
MPGKLKVSKSKSLHDRYLGSARVRIQLIGPVYSELKQKATRQSGIVLTS